MKLRVSDLKIGAKLIFGAYGVKSSTAPITWLKANDECNFVSAFVLDILQFDAEERCSNIVNHRYAGNSAYSLSNVRQFLNSCEPEWYEPTHIYDSPPRTDTNTAHVGYDYVDHPGFLYHFKDYEIESLNSEVSILTSADVLGNGITPKLPLFNRKGYRGRPSANMIEEYGMAENEFCDYWVRDVHNTYNVKYITRNGKIGYRYPSNIGGLRPQCRIHPNTQVEPMPDGSGFRIIPFDANKFKRASTTVCTDEEFLAMMGLL